ncbi:MAG TPA: AmmeMemoRadiSam system protein B [Rhodocyclaceae bacterium]
MQTPQIRPPAVAGMFYPGDAKELSAEIGTMLAAAKLAAVRPKALIVPHAGYVYSGPVAAYAYALLAPLRDSINRVVLFGPTHRVYAQGLAVPSAAAFATPLGSVPLDRQAIDAALRLPQVRTNDEAHAMEHSLEVQLPFLQTVLGDFRLVPFAVGEASAAEVAEVMETLWGGDETLIVVSSDLSHYHPYAAAQLLDRQTADDLLRLRPLEDYEQACGALPINGLVAAAPRHGLSPHLLDLRNSGDTAGDKSRVVGYAAFAFAADDRHG